MADSRIHVIYENASGHNRQGWVTIPHWWICYVQSRPS